MTNDNRYKTALGIVFTLEEQRLIEAAARKVENDETIREALRVSHDNCMAWAAAQSALADSYELPADNPINQRLRGYLDALDFFSETFLPKPTKQKGD